jgi:hypothetical protein
MAVETKDAVAVPPYVSFATFTSFLKSLGQGVPGRIDKSVMSNLAGGVQVQLISALKYLKLIHADGSPTDKLAPLVTSEGADYQKALRGVLTAAYPFLSDGHFKLETATPKMLTDEFSKLATGDTVRKCETFFIPAVTAAGIPIGHHIKQPKKRTATNGKAKKPKATPAAGATPTPPPATPAGQQHEQQPAAMSWHQLLLSKFPSFDPAWPDDVKSKWMDSFADLMKKGGGP